MKLSTRIIAGLLLILSIGVESCDTFKDEVTPNSYSEAPKDVNGSWKLKTVLRNGTDITEKMDFSNFCIHLNEDGTYAIDNYLPFVVKENGTWRVDDPLYPFHILFNEDGTEEEQSTTVSLLVVNGQRQLKFELSPGCYSNTYIYTFEKITE